MQPNALECVKMRLYASRGVPNAAECIGMRSECVLNAMVCSCAVHQVLCVFLEQWSAECIQGVPNAAECIGMRLECILDAVVFACDAHQVLCVC